MNEPEKPKTSTIEKMSYSDLVSLDKLARLCGDYYHKVSNPSKPSPHTNPNEIDELKKEILLQSLKVGERIWHPRGNPDSITFLEIQYTNGRSNKKSKPR